MRLQRVIQSVMFEPWDILPTAHYTIQRLVAAHLAGVKSGDIIDGFAPPQDEYRIEDGIAVIPVQGVVGRRLSAMEKKCGGVDTADIANQIKTALADPAVVGILLDADTPGGMHQSTPELAQLVAEADKEKPCWCYTDGLLASAGFYIAAGCGQIYASPSAEVGSIGSYIAVLDESQAYAAEGLKVELFASGKYKGAGIPGLPLTDDQKAMFKAMVSEASGSFKAFVKQCRPHIPDEAMEGQGFWATSAFDNGLVDAVGSREQCLADLRKFARMR